MAKAHSEWTYPRLERSGWKCPHCEANVAERIEQATADMSCGLLEKVTVICSQCEAELTFRIRWELPAIHSVQLVKTGDPWFEVQSR